MHNGYHAQRRRDIPRRSDSFITIGAVLIILGLATLILYLYLFNTTQAMHAISPGAGARDYLSDERYSEMLIEVDFVQRFPPDTQAISTFERNVEKYVYKDDVRVLQDDDFDLQSEEPCIDTLENLESNYRDYYTEGNTVVLYIIYVSGHCSEDEGEIGGVTYTSSSIAIYKETIVDNIPPQDPEHQLHRRIAEANILLHEFGHIIGLVNEAGFQSQYDHEDPDHPYHSKYTNSVMYYQATYLTYQDFDFYDRADIQAIRDSEYPPDPEPEPLLIYGAMAMVIGGAVAIGAGGVLRRSESKKLTAIERQRAQEARSFSAQAQTAGRQYHCPYCGKPIAFIQKYDRWFCYSCYRYL